MSVRDPSGAKARMFLLGLGRAFRHALSELVVRVSLEKLPSLEQQMFQNRSQAQCREEGEGAQNEDHADQQHSKHAVFTGKVPARRHTLLACQIAAKASTGISMRKRPASMVQPSIVLYHHVLAFRPAKAEPLLAAAEVKA